jgi:NAD+ diphosphatase
VTTTQCPGVPLAGSAPPLLTRAALDRAARLRADAAGQDRLWADPRARVLRVDAGTALGSGDPWALAYADPEAFSADPALRYFLGLDGDGVPYFAVDGPFSPAAGQSALALRRIGPSLPALEVGLFVHAVALGAWHGRHRFCPSCGEPTVPEAGGHSRACGSCGLKQFPRLDPAVIMLVTDDEDRALLGHNTAWPAGRFSTLAGFVEVGESAEQAVVREVAEEVGLEIDRVEYEGSQPWPFPSSLMLAYRAHASDPRLRVDHDELTAARWFTRPGLLDAIGRGDVLLPSSVSIARWQVERWYGGPLPTEQDW